ncbi:LysR family transcriptional regulator [Stenotrophomonas forensis]|uniref:LysR family transcriptional regulator n=2 Tax=Pseudomonadota TaxID=1224 RepID=UPI0039C72387
MVSLDRFDIFRAVVEAGSLTAAADRLGLSRAVVSFNLKRLEQELGVTLLLRSTRHLALTEAGEQFLQHCVQALDAAQAAIDAARRDQHQLQGVLRLTTTPEYAQLRLIPALEAFRARHPALQLHLSTSPAPAHLIPERFDLAIRLGRLPDSGLHAIELERHPLCAVAAPMLLARLPSAEAAEAAEAADDPAQLGALPRLGYPRLADVPVVAPDGSDALFATNPGNAVVRVDGASSLRAFAVAGAGVTVLPRWLIEDDLAQDRLRLVLRQHRFPQQSVYAVYPHSTQPSPKVRQLIDFLRIGLDASAPGKTP